jgi:hypothetical protein
VSAADCIRQIRESAPDLSEDEITEIVEELQRRLDARKARGGLASMDEELLNEADELAGEMAQAAQVEKRNRYINVVKRQQLTDLAARADDANGDPSLGLEAAMVGVNAPFAGSRQSVDARYKAIFTSYLGGMSTDMKRAGVHAHFTSGALEREIAQELEQLTLPNGQRGISGSNEALRIAEIIDKYRQTNIARQNRAGAWIKPLPGYITRQTHDMSRIRRAGREDWKNTIRPLLDESTFRNASDRQAFLDEVYNGLATGVHLKAEGEAESDLGFAFKGSGNLAKRVSQHRVLHFRDADAWLQYNERFGKRSLTEAIVQDLEMGARNTALMETFGTNPRAMFDDVRERVRTQFRDDPKKVDRLGRSTIGDRLENQFREIDGSANIPGNPSVAAFGQAFRAQQTLAKLGGAFISSVTDIGFAASEVRFQRGGNPLANHLSTLNNILEGVSGGDRQRTAELIGVGLDGQIGDYAARFSAQDQTTGRVAKLQNLFFKLNLLGPWTDANKRGVGLMMARDLAMQSDRAWDELDPRTSRLLAQYGMDAARWDVARQAVRTAEDGRAYLMPDAVRDLDDVTVGAAGRDARRVRDEIETALRSYYVDRADYASPTPGARERAMLRQGYPPGTAVGEAWRFVTQFKAFPVTALSKPFGREVYGQGARTLRDAMLKGEGDLLGMASMVASTTLLGYVAMAAKDLAKGREPRDPTDPSTWQAAALQGGGLGIYGDFLLGETNRYGRSLTDTLAGPAIGTVASLDELRAKMMAGELGWADVLRVAESEAPFTNLFYTQAALDYLIFYQLQEAANPGYLRRMERNLEREQNQSFIVPPSDTIPRGGGDTLFEGVR